MLTACSGERRRDAESVGIATMRLDGVIVLQLRSADRGRIVEAYREIKPSDADYQKTIDHLRGIKPGEEKPIPPWETGR